MFTKNILNGKLKKRYSFQSQGFLEKTGLGILGKSWRENTNNFWNRRWLDDQTYSGSCLGCGALSRARQGVTRPDFAAGPFPPLGCHTSTLFSRAFFRHTFLPVPSLLPLPQRYLPLYNILVFTLSCKLYPGNCTLQTVPCTLQTVNCTLEGPESCIGGSWYWVDEQEGFVQ